MAYYPKDSVSALTDDQGEVTDRIQYSPYGIITHREGETDTAFLYSGQHGIQTKSHLNRYQPLLETFTRST